MKYIISEKHLANLIVKQEVKDDLEYNHVSDAEPSKDDFVIGQEMDEQDSGDDSSASDEHSSSMGADEYPAYPEVSKWDPKIKRGHANQIDVTNWKSGIERGTGNPIAPSAR